MSAPSYEPALLQIPAFFQPAFEKSVEQLRLAHECLEDAELPCAVTILNNVRVFCAHYLDCSIVLRESGPAVSLATLRSDVKSMIQATSAAYATFAAMNAANRGADWMEESAHAVISKLYKSLTTSCGSANVRPLCE